MTNYTGSLTKTIDDINVNRNNSTNSGEAGKCYSIVHKLKHVKNKTIRLKKKKLRFRPSLMQPQSP